MFFRMDFHSFGVVYHKRIKNPIHAESKQPFISRVLFLAGPLPQIPPYRFPFPFHPPTTNGGGRVVGARKHY